MSMNPPSKTLLLENTMKHIDFAEAEKLFPFKKHLSFEPLVAYWREMADQSTKMRSCVSP